VNAFQAELRKFIKSRGEVSPPRSPGKLHTKDSHAYMMTHAMDQTINYYKTIIPNSSSPKYKRIILAEQRLKQLQYERHVQMRQPGARINANSWYKTPGSMSPHSSNTPLYTPGTPKIRVDVMKIPNSPLNHKLVGTPIDFQSLDGDMLSVYSNGSSNSSTTLFQQLGFSPPPTSPSSKRSRRPLRITLEKDKRYKKTNLVIKSKPVPGMPTDVTQTDGSFFGKDDEEEEQGEAKKASKKFQPWQPTRRLQAVEMDPFQKATIQLANESLIGTHISPKPHPSTIYDDFMNSCASSVQIIQEIAGDSGYVHYYAEDDEHDEDDPLPTRPMTGFLAPSASHSATNSIGRAPSNDDDDNRSNASMLQLFTAEYPDVAALVPPLVDQDELSHASNYSEIHAPVILPAASTLLSYPPPMHHYHPRSTSPIPPNVVLEEETTTSSITDETGKYVVPTIPTNSPSLMNLRLSGPAVSLTGSSSIQQSLGGVGGGGSGLESVLQIKAPVLHPHTPTTGSGANTGRAKLSKPTTPKLPNSNEALQSDESSEYMNIPVPMKVSITHPRRSWSVPVDDELSFTDAFPPDQINPAPASVGAVGSGGDGGTVATTQSSYIPYDEEMEGEIEEELRQMLNRNHPPSLPGSAPHKKRYHDDEEETDTAPRLHYPKFDMDSIKQFQAFDNPSTVQAASHSAPSSTKSRAMSHTTPAPRQKTFGVSATNARNPFHQVKRKKPAHLPPLSILSPEEVQEISAVPVNTLSLVGTLPVTTTSKQRTGMPMNGKNNRASVGTTPLQLQQSHSTLDFPSYQWNSPYHAPSVNSHSTSSQTSSVGSSYFGNLQPNTPIQQVTVTMMNSSSMSSLPAEKRKK
jgi:hypothetical protein